VHAAVGRVADPDFRFVRRQADAMTRTAVALDLLRGARETLDLDAMQQLARF